MFTSGTSLSWLKTTWQSPTLEAVATRGCIPADWKFPLSSQMMLKWTCVRKRVPQMPPVRKPAERAKMHIWDIIMMMLFRIMMVMLVMTCLMMVVISMIYIGIRVLIILIIMVMMMQTKNDGICWWWELQWWKFYFFQPGTNVLQSVLQ